MVKEKRMKKMAVGKAINKKSGIFISITHIFTKEDNGFIAKCPELGIYGQGDTIEEAEKNILDAVGVFLNSVEAMGLRDNIFKERNIKVYKYRELPKEEIETIAISPVIDENSFYRKTFIAI